MNKKVTVIVPIYNVEQYLKRCVDSILLQTYQELEIILVNDGSTDNSLQLCNQMVQQDHRIRLIDKVNGGLSDARNAGLKQATGEFVCFIDSDDFILPTMIEKMVNQAEVDQADICVCDMEYLYDDGTKSFASGGLVEKKSVQEMPELIRINNSACNKLFKTSMFQDIQFPVGKYYEDLATVPILLYKANKITKVDEPFYVYYQRTGSIAHTASKKIFDIYDAIASCIDYVQEHGHEAEILKELYHLYILHGLDLTTVRIKDFDDRTLIAEYMLENMELLEQHYPNYKEDTMLQEYSWKKKLIFKLLEQKKVKLVMKIYGK